MLDDLATWRLDRAGLAAGLAALLVFLAPAAAARVNAPKTFDLYLSNNYTAPANYQKVDPINGVMQYDPSTLEMQPAFYTSGLDSVSGEGIWTLAGDSDNCLWFGGDIYRDGFSGTAADWADVRASVIVWSGSVPPGVAS